MPSTEAESVAVLAEPARVDEPHIHVVAAVIRDASNPGRFLIAQRQKGKHLQDFWEFPGGKLEAGETRWDGLRRELREEIDIDATLGEPLMRVYCRYPQINVLLDVWTVSEYSGLPRGRERQRLAWISTDQVGAYRFPPADKPILEFISRNGLTGS